MTRQSSQRRRLTARALRELDSQQPSINLTAPLLAYLDPEDIKARARLSRTIQSEPTSAPIDKKHKRGTTCTTEHLPSKKQCRGSELEVKCESTVSSSCSTFTYPSEPSSSFSSFSSVSQNANTISTAIKSEPSSLNRSSITEYPTTSSITTGSKNPSTSTSITSKSEPSAPPDSLTSRRPITDPFATAIMSHSRISQGARYHAERGRAQGDIPGNGRGRGGALNPQSTPRSFEPNRRPASSGRSSMGGSRRSEDSYYPGVHDKHNIVRVKQEPNRDEIGRAIDNNNLGTAHAVQQLAANAAASQRPTNLTERIQILENQLQEAQSRTQTLESQVKEFQDRTKDLEKYTGRIEKRYEEMRAATTAVEDRLRELEEYVHGGGSIQR